MKKIKVVFVLFLIVIFLVSCNSNGINSVLTDEQYARKQGKTIVECFDTRDADTLKKMFSQSSQEKCDLEKQIQTVFDLYEGKSISYEFIYYGVEGGTENGEWTDKHIHPSIYLETDTGKKYKITFYEYLIYIKDETMLGIDYIAIYDCGNNDINFLADIGGDN